MKINRRYVFGLTLIAVLLAGSFDYPAKYTPEGSQLMAKQVAEYLMEQL